MNAPNPSPRLKDLIDSIKGSGSGASEYFGYPEKADGLYLQQDPPEFAAFVEYMANNVPSSRLSLDIGVASGGQTKFLRDYYKCDQTIVVDLGEHPEAYHWKRIQKDVKSDIILQLIDDSHSETVRNALQQFKGRIDFAFIDGDHSYRGLKQDIFLARELMQAGGFMGLHDTLGVEECRRVHAELLKSANFEHIRDFNSRFGISLWRLKTPVPASLLNRRFGFGYL